MARGLLLLLLVCLGVGFGRVEARPAISKDLNETVEMIAIDSGFGQVAIETTLFIPPGPGPFPLVVINHGKAFGNPKFDPRARYTVASREFLRRGYLVAIPMRPGFARSEGAYIDTGCNTESNGRLQAESVIGVLDQLVRRPQVDPGNILVIGQSHGGLTALALGAKGYPGLKGILNFAGGFKYEVRHCTWEKSMIEAFAAYGRTTRVPSLWFYGDNDSYWGAELPLKAHEAYQLAGGNARLVAFGIFAGGDAHGMFGNARGLAVWWPETEQFLQRVGLPTRILFDVEGETRPPKTNFAPLDRVSAVPYLKDTGRENYAKFLTMPYPRAFAIATNGTHGWAYEGTNPMERALKNCETRAKTTCRLYAVDDDVVWPDTAEVK